MITEPAGRRRVFLLGLDGATWTLLRPWVEEGYLPTLAGLMAGGAAGVLRSTLPPVTPVAWTSMVTGVHPGKHGIFGFVKSQPGRYAPTVVTSRDRRRPALWNLLDAAGLRSIVVDVPFTYPPDPINGVMIAGLGTPDVSADFVHPRPLREVILREFGTYPLDIYYRKNPEGMLEQARRLTDHRFALTRFLLREFPWEFFMMVLMPPDRISHNFWWVLDPAHPRHDPAEAARLGPLVRDYYRRLDYAVGDLLGRLGSDTAFLVASDHGSGPLCRTAMLGRWLYGQGHLAAGSRRFAFAPPDHAPGFATAGAGRVRQHGAAGIIIEVDDSETHAGALFRIPGLDRMRRYRVTARVRDATPGVLLELDDLACRENPIIGGARLAEDATEITTLHQPRGDSMDLLVCLTTHNGNPSGRVTLESLTLDEVQDWSRTRAYVLDASEAPQSQRIRLNVRGREPQGIVEPGGEYERLRQEIAEGLLKLRGPDGRSVVRAVHRWEEVYRGPYGEDGGDLLIIYEDDVSGAGHDTPTRIHTLDGPVVLDASGRMSGKHRPEGIFVARGNGIARGQALSLDIVDICPLVLTLLGVRALDDLDGRIPPGMLSTAQAPDAAPSAAVPQAAAPEVNDAYSNEDRLKVEERLRRLGYIE